MAYQTGDIICNFQVNYELGEQIDESTFFVWVSYPHMDGFRSEATIQLYEDIDEARRVYRLSKSINDTNVIQALSICHQKNRRPFIVFDKFYKNNLAEWISELERRFREVSADEKLIATLNENLISTLKGITRGLKLLNENNSYHGQLRDGFRVSEEGHVQLVNFQPKASFEEGTREDIENLKWLVGQVQDRYLTRQPRVALDLFHNLENVFLNQPNGLADDGLLRLYAFFMYKNALFTDDGDQYDLMEKFVQLRTMNPIAFDNSMDLARDPTDIGNWRDKVKTTPALYSVFHLERKVGNEPKENVQSGSAGNRTPKKYTSNGSFILFYKNCLKHLEVPNVPAPTRMRRHLYFQELYPDAIYKLFFAFVRDIGIGGSFNGYEVVSYFSMDTSSHM